MTENEFENKVFSSLNEEQKIAVKTVDGPVLLLAVPGSGKTTVVEKRLGYMLYVAGIAPESILSITYTVAAAKEMRSRFQAEFGPEYAGRTEFRTINSLAQNIIDVYGQTCSRRRPFAIESDESRLNGIIRKIYAELKEEYPDDSTVKEVRTAITYVKNQMLSAEEIEEYDCGIREFPEIFRRYNSELRTGQKMDFDDQLSYAYRILKTIPEVLSRFQQRYLYINVDEAQDTSRVQHEILRLLAEKEKNLFMVGDEDQSIYGFRAAYPEALIAFPEEYPGAKILYLEKNYRSTPQIISAANALIARNRGRYAKSAVAVRKDGAAIEHLTFSRRTAQMEYICRIAEKCERETAFLFRNNDSVVPLIDLFERKGLRYNCRVSDEVFFTNRILTDISDIVAFAGNPCDAEVFLRIYYKFNCGISKKAALAAVRVSEATGKSLLSVLENSGYLKQFSRDNVSTLAMHLRMMLRDSAETAVRRIWSAMGYGDFVRRMKLDENKYDILIQLAKNEKSILTLMERLGELRKIISEHVNADENRVILSTIHSAKGLEYDRVFLLDAYNGILPAKAKEDLETDEDRKVYEEDRRIFYVGMTRAKNELHIADIGKRADFIREVFPPEVSTYEEAVQRKENMMKKYGLLFPQKKQ